jgi:hypothetical protein
MHASARRTIMFLSSLSIALGFAAADARADDAGQAGPCGRFDFRAGIACEIKVSGGCSADCSSFKFEAACSGGCTSMSTTTCVDDCGTQCIKTCDPALLDCFVGCHAECDDPTFMQCQQKHPTDDCQTTARAQCDVHCKDSCKVQPSSCSEHCTKCCTGSCDTQVNFDCDFSCFAEVKGGCDVQCQRPEGAIFCNGQYVNASDVQACISYLATQGINVDASARGSVTCDLNGCHAEGDASAGLNVPPIAQAAAKGCALTPGSADSTGAGGVGLALSFLFMAQRRRRRL